MPDRTIYDLTEFLKKEIIPKEEKKEFSLPGGSKIPLPTSTYLYFSQLAKTSISLEDLNNLVEKHKQ